MFEGRKKKKKKMIRGLQNNTGGIKIVVMFCSRVGLRFHPGQKWNSKISTLIFFFYIFEANQHPWLAFIIRFSWEMLWIYVIDPLAQGLCPWVAWPCPHAGRQHFCPVLSGEWRRPQHVVILQVLISRFRKKCAFPTEHWACIARCFRWRHWETFHSE